MTLRVGVTLEQLWHRVPGGTATSVAALVRALVREQVDVVGVSAAHLRGAPDRFSLPVAIRRLPLPRPLLYEAWHRLRVPQVQRATGPIDVLHATTLAVPPKSAPLVVTIHDLAFLHDPAHFTPRGLRFFNKGLELALQDADLVACPSHASAEDCAAHGFARDRLRVVPWGVTPDRAGADDVARVRATLGLDGPYVLWAGTVEPRKNLPALVDAFLSLDTPASLVLAGPPGWNEDLDRLVARGRGRVRGVGFLGTRALRALYAGASVFCYPSLLEGFGLPVLEAMAQGAPVVTSRGTATEEAAGGAAVLVDPRDTGSIADGLRRLLEDESERVRLAQAGRERAAAMTWEACAMKMVSVYEELAAR